VCVCFKLSLFATCALRCRRAGGRTCVRAYLLEACRAGRRKKVGAEMATTKVQRIMTQPIVRSSSFHLFFFCSKFVFVLLFLPPFRFVKVCGSLGVSSVRIRLLGILHFTFHSRPCFFLPANRH